MQDLKVVGNICNELVNELTRAANECGHGPFVNRHEGFAVLLEELEELKAEVFKKDPYPADMRTEAIHVGAMAIKFILMLENQSEEKIKRCGNCGSFSHFYCRYCANFSNWTLKAKEE